MKSEITGAARQIPSAALAGVSDGRQKKLLGSTALSSGLSVLGATILVLSATPAHAASCTPIPAPHYQCSGASTAPVSVAIDNVAVTTTPGFSVDISGPAATAMAIGGYGTISYIDANASPLSGYFGLSAVGAGNAGVIPGTLTIDTGGKITGSIVGIYAENYGAGTTNVTATGVVTGTQTYGILAANGAVTLKPDGTVTVAPSAGTNLTVDAATVTGGVAGIYADNEGKGKTSVTVSGLVTGTAGDGVYVKNGTAATDLSIDTAGATGSFIGIYARNEGTGATSVTASGPVTGSGGDGIYVYNGTIATDLSIDAADTIDGFVGIYADNGGTGATNVTATGTTTGTHTDGIVVSNGIGASDLSIKAAAVIGRGDGIYAQNLGTGTIGISATGDVSGTTGYGIYASNGSAATDLTVDAASVTGGVTGIVAYNGGTGTTSVTATGTVTGTQIYGILATNGAVMSNPDGTVASVGPSAATDLTVDAANVTGGVTGIYAINEGSGVTSVTTTGIATGTQLYGILASNGGAATDLTIDAATTTGGNSGIYAYNAGTGATHVTSDGAATGTQLYGIVALNRTAATDLTVDAASTTGGYAGIYAYNQGTGATRVTATGATTGATAFGIVAFNGTAATDLNIDAASVTGGQDGILAENEGTGATSITASGLVTGGENSAAIDAYNRITTTDLSIDAAAATGGYAGIYAENGGAGTTSITATGAVTGIQVYGILAVNGTMTFNPDGTFANVLPSAATNLTVKAASVTGGVDGVDAINQGTGATSVTTTGLVVGTAQYGIYADNGGATRSGMTDLGVDAASATGGGVGIYAENYGTGATSISATGAATGTATDSLGIFGFNASTATSLTIAAASASGGDMGIYAVNNGSGASRVTATGPVVGITGDGIDLLSATDVTVNAASVSGGTTGISVYAGSGATSITATGAVTGTGGMGIEAYNDVAATSLTVNAADVSGGKYGILTQNVGTGPTSVSMSGIVEGGIAGIGAMTDGHAINILIAGPGAQVRNASLDPMKLAIAASGGPVALTNAARLTGTVQLGDSDDRFVNSGTWTNAGGLSDFGAGADSLVNEQGGVIAAAISTGRIETTRFAGLESFTNRGTIALQDGGVGDVAHFSGNFIAGAGAHQSIDINKAGGSDLVLVDGSATITGTTLDVLDPDGYVFGRRYTVLTATGGLTGEFAKVNWAVETTAFAGILDSYDANNAYLEYGQVRAFADAGETPNQIAAATGADSLALGNTLKDAILMLPDDATARDAFDQLSGEIHPAIRTAMADDSRLPRAAVLERLSDGAGGSAWGQVFGNWGTSDGDRNAASLDRNTKGFVIGADAGLADAVTLGVAGGYTDTDADLDARRSSGSVKTIHALGYVGADFGGFRLKAGAGYGWANVDTRRSVAFPGLTDGLRASYDGSILQGFGEIAYAVPLGGGKIEPFAGVAAIRAHTDAFTETGGIAALSAAERREDSVISTAGLHFETSPAGPLTVRGTIGWQHGFGTLDAASRVAFAGGDDFTVLGTAQSRDAGIAKVEAGLRLSPRISLSLAYDGVLGSAGQDHAVKGGLRIAF